MAADSAIVTQNQPEYQSSIETRVRPQELEEGEVLIHNQHSSLNYKDALAVTGRGRILKNFPLVPGIDCAGTIAASRSSQWKEGDEVLATGCGLGEAVDGGYATWVKASENWVVKRTTLSSFEAMTFGTAGFTTAIAVHRMIVNGQTPDLGPILVTGASGGVGMFAVDILSRLGFEVHALSGKKDQHERLCRLGAAEVLAPEELDFGTRPLESVRYGGAIDNVGGSVLEGLLRHTQLWGNIASIGLASGHAFSATVMPHILRGVSLLGISSANCPLELRRELWERLADEYRPGHLSEIRSREISLDEVIPTANEMLERKTYGRVVVRI